MNIRLGSEHMRMYDHTARDVLHNDAPTNFPSTCRTVAHILGSKRKCGAILTTAEAKIARKPQSQRVFFSRTCNEIAKYQTR